MKIKSIIAAPTCNRILIKQSEIEQKIEGIHVPETAIKKPRKGIVVAASEEYKCPANGVVKPVIAVGDVVMYENHTGVEIEIDGEDFILLKEPDAFVVL